MAVQVVVLRVVPVAAQAVAVLHVPLTVLAVVAVVVQVVALRPAAAAAVGDALAQLKEG